MGDPFYFFEITETTLKKQGGIVTGEYLGRDNSIKNIFEITERRLKERGSSELVTGEPLEENCSGGRRRALLAEEEEETFPCTTRRETKESNFIADAFYI